MDRAACCVLRAAGNDGNVYCNITTFDWTQPAVRQLWVDTVLKATATGLVDGVFADHSSNEGISIGGPRKEQAPNQLCNGNGANHHCFNFTDDFRDSFNSWSVGVLGNPACLLSLVARSCFRAYMVLVCSQ